MVLTRATLVGISASCISVIINNLVQILEDLSKSHKGINTHPIHVLESELYILELLAECFSVHWASINTPGYCESGFQYSIKEVIDSEQVTKPQTNAKSFLDNKKTYRNLNNSIGQPPKALDDHLVKRLIDAVKLFSRPISENLNTPTINILDEALYTPTEITGLELKLSKNDHSNSQEVSRLLSERANAIETYTRDIMGYISLSNWPRVLEYFKNALHQATYSGSGNTPASSIISDEEKNLLITLRLMTSLWVDSRKLNIMIQEICSTFLHLQKSFQITITIVLPLLITRWLENNPKEFVELHERNQWLDGAADTLFDMAHTLVDGARRKSILPPFQISLLFLLPEAFEVVRNTREAKSGGISKKASFLESLRKLLRNRNETAIYCLTSILRVARHFPVNSGAALLSFALDIQEEVRDAVFKRHSNIDSSLMTATFVTLVHLNFSICVESLVPLCLAANAPQEYKISVISACIHLAKQKNFEDYQPLFVKASEFIRAQLKV